MKCRRSSSAFSAALMSFRLPRDKGFADRLSATSMLRFAMERHPAIVRYRAGRQVNGMAHSCQSHGQRAYRVVVSDFGPV